MEELGESIIDDDDIFFGLPEEEVDLLECDFIWEGEFEEFEEERPVSLSSSSKTKKASKSKTGKKQTDKDQNKPPRLQCTHCPKTYANKRTLKTHLTTVALKDAASRFPEMGDLQNEMESLAISALKNVETSFTIGSLALSCSSYAKKLRMHMETYDSSELLEFLAAEFRNLYSVESVTFLSKLRDMATLGTNRLLNSVQFKDMLKSLCLLMVECAENVLNFFTGNFISILSNKVLIFVSECMQKSKRDAAVHKKRSKDDFSSPDFKKIVHYIGGAAVAGILKRERTYPQNVNIKSFNDILRSNFIEDKEDATTCCDLEIREWTETQDRGRLRYLSLKAFHFFHELVSFVMGYEEEDGSVLLAKVHSGLETHFDLLEMWDLLVPWEEGSSLEWLTAVVEVVCRTVSNGILRRRLNDAIKKPQASVGLRPKLAR